MINNTKKTDSKCPYLLIAGSSTLLAILVTLGVLYWADRLTLPEANNQVMVRDMGSQVMPFDLDETTHIFEMTEGGGIQQVVAKNPDDSAQIALIQQHIQHEAILFSSGNFSDPTSLHGTEMPGVKDLAAGIETVEIEYANLPNGAQISFTTQDLGLITALHRWFGAQLSDHGADATYR